MHKIKLRLLLIVIFFIFTQGLWERIFFFVPEIGVIVDICALLFILFQPRYNFNVPGSFIFIGFFIITLISSLVNEINLLDALLYIRYPVYFYLIFNQLFKLPIGAVYYTKILKFLLWLIVAQGAGSFYTLFVIGEQTEGYVGLMSSLGGSTATVFPLLISCLILVYYLFRPKIPRKIIFYLIVLLLTVALVGFSSGKRTIYFIIPLFTIAVVAYSFSIATSKWYFYRKISVLIIFVLLISPLIIYGIANSKGLNYALSGKETNLEIIQNAINYASETRDAKDEQGNTISRFNTSDQVFSAVSKDPERFLFGYGFRSPSGVEITKDPVLMNKLGLGYGIVGYTRDLIAGGFSFMLFPILLISIVITNNRSAKYKITRTLRFTLFAVFIWTHFFYSADFTVSLKISILYAIILALINSPQHLATLQHLFAKHKITIK